ncbi:hypothetical protein K2173_008984 [Erythroxylum novogranatense]|uniref:RING-type E3 ubiquitin transferase n=1 Tax=Erythroxylum novogranatense TaxID=1862640 RepID=A0AAV8TSG9_9ROSI|nr:hypothetical protein K2173_008984 [Erythroxylum novogranatense]
MSFDGASTAGGDAAKLFFCHQCDRPVTVSICPSSELSCPLCHGGFIEEYENPNSNLDFHNQATPFNISHQDPFSTILPLIFSSASAAPADFQNPHFPNSPEPNAFNPFDFLRDHIQNLQSGGARIQFVIENHPSGRSPANLGDYFIGPGLEQLIQQLAENDPNRYGTPPAAKSAIDALPTIEITGDSEDSEKNHCPVCKDEFVKGIEAKQMPCEHIYHQDCLIPWLEMHNSCPVCRYQLPTDNVDYESVRRADQDGARGGDTRENRAVERRFNISLPWPFGRQGSSSDGGSAGGRNND